MFEVSSFTAFLVNNKWWIVALVMALEVVIIDIVRLGVYIRDDQMFGKTMTTLDNHRAASNANYFAKGCNTEMKVVVALQCIAMGVWMYVESGRGVIQLLRDIGPTVNVWIWFAAGMVTIGMAMLPLLFEREYWKKGRLIAAGFLGMIIVFDTMSLGSCEVAGVAATIAFAWASYWAIDVWFMLAQYLILAVIFVDEIITMAVFALYHGVSKIVTWIYDQLSGRAAKRKQAELFSEDFARAVRGIKSDRVAFDVPSVEEDGRTIIDIYDVLAALELQSYIDNLYHTDVPMLAEAKVVSVEPTTSTN